MKPPTIVLIFLILLAVAQTAYFAPQLPERAASHFDGAGNPDGWSTRSGLLLVYWFAVGACLLTALVMGRIIGVVPIRLINLPNKEYWLGPQRRDETLRYFQTAFAWFGASTLTLLLIVFQLVFMANLTSRPQLPGVPMYTVVVVYAAFSLAWTMRLIWHFSRNAERAA